MVSTESRPLAHMIHFAIAWTRPTDTLRAIPQSSYWIPFWMDLFDNHACQRAKWWRAPGQRATRRWANCQRILSTQSSVTVATEKIVSSRFISPVNGLTVLKWFTIVILFLLWWPMLRHVSCRHLLVTFVFLIPCSLFISSLTRQMFTLLLSYSQLFISWYSVASHEYVNCLHFKVK